MRSKGAGLGAGGPLKVGPNDTYKDAVRKTMYSRYQDME